MENSSRDVNTRQPDLCPEKSVCSSRSQQLEPYMKQLAGSKLGKEYNKTVYCHPAYLTSMQSPSFEMLSWMNHKLESRLPVEISTTSHMEMIPLAESKEELEPLDEGERGE